MLWALNKKEIPKKWHKLKTLCQELLKPFLLSRKIIRISKPTLIFWFYKENLPIQKIKFKHPVDFIIPTLWNITPASIFFPQELLPTLSGLKKWNFLNCRTIKKKN